jgi:hypothetical protein
MKNISLLTSVIYIIFWLSLSGCGVPPPISSPEYGDVIQERLGLATQWGETRSSQVVDTQFTRANNYPTERATIYYNDQAGIIAMTPDRYFAQRILPMWLNVGFYGIVSIGLHNERGQLLEGRIMNGKGYVIGEAGHRYSIVVRNNTNVRLEVVLSVDGLDVIDGKPAAFGKSGYVIAPHATLTVDGFRQSMDEVAAFRFGSVSQSYANKKYGDTRSVGVIGLAVFHPWGSQPFSQRTIQDEARKRYNADPFPGRFATPP